MASARVTVQGPTTLTVSTDARGMFALDRLPLGQYRASVMPPSSVTHIAPVETKPFQIDSTRRCAELYFDMEITGTVSGRLRYDTGAPASGVFVQLGPAAELDLSRGPRAAGVVTGDDGAFSFPNLPPGAYVVGVNLYGEPNGLSPVTPARALTTDGQEVVYLRRGETIQLPPLVVQRLSELKVPATVVGPDGKSIGVVDLRVRMLDAPAPYSTQSVRTDANGRVTLHLWRGQRYRIWSGATFNADVDVEFVATEGPLTLTLIARH
jgi:hypothetical protein